MTIIVDEGFDWLHETGPGAELFKAFRAGGDERWKTARGMEVYTRSEEAGRAAKWLA